MNTLKQISVITDIEPLNEFSMDELRGGALFDCCFINSKCNKNNTTKSTAQK